MFLQRKLVKIIEEFNLKNPACITRQNFIDHITEDRLWPRLNYPFYQRDKLRRRINTAINDCIHYKYLQEKTDKKILTVTPSGRDFSQRPSGFFEEFRKRRKRTSDFLFGGAAGAIITWFILHVWPLISSELGL